MSMDEIEGVQLLIPIRLRCRGVMLTGLGNLYAFLQISHDDCQKYM